jgi:MFS superfamily sulfate permease-like transporter
MKTEDVAAAFVAIITLILTIIPTIQNVVPPEYATAVLAVALILKAVLGDLQGPSQPVTYKVTAKDPQGNPYSGLIVVTPPQTIDQMIANLRSLGFTQIVTVPVSSP